MTEPLLDHLLEDPPELTYPYYDSVPKLPKDNLEFRDELPKSNVGKILRRELRHHK